jgi:putative chitinase
MTATMALRGIAKADARAADPDWLKTPAGATYSACWFWSTRKLNALADAWELTAITRVINGGTLGLSERISLANAAYKWLS